MKPTLDEFLKKYGLESKVIEYAAKGDDCNTAHWLRNYKDLLRMYRDDVPREEYDGYIKRYASFKREAESLLGEELSL